MIELTNEALTRKILKQTQAFILEQTKRLGDPVDLPEDRYRAFVKDRRAELRQGINKTKFLLFSNMKTGALEHCFGLEEVMGWKASISVREYFDKIHPEYLPYYLKWSMAVYQLAYELRQQIVPCSQSFNLSIPLLHGNGKYYWCSMQGVPVRLDGERNLVVHLNSYRKQEQFSEFNRRLMEPFLCHESASLLEWNQKLKEKVTPFVLEILAPHRRKVLELNIANTFERHGALVRPSNKAIAEKMGKNENTIKGYNKEILEIAYILTGKHFHDAHEVAMYFGEQGFLKVEKDCIQKIKITT